MLKGKAALVTGSTSGIGAAIAQNLASQGANIILNGFGDATQIESDRSMLASAYVCPGYVWTPLVEMQIPETAKARGLTEEQVINDVLLHAQPTKKFVTVDEVAALAGFLSNDTAASITAAIIPVDGGWTAQ
jgi:3-hydroxybutyrate dehydrogenase